MLNNKITDDESFKEKIDEIIIKNKLSWEKSIAMKEAVGKLALVLTPVSIFLFFVVRLFNIFEIKNINNAIIPFFMGIFFLWIWYKSYGLLLSSREIVSPWALGWVEKAMESKRLEKNIGSKKGINFWLGIFFIFFGSFILLGSSSDGIMGRVIGLGLSVMFIFIGFLGIINFIVWKKPETALFILENNRKINILIFAVISLFCLTFIISPIIFMLT